MRNNIKQHYADLSLLLVTAIWGTTFVIVQNAISFLPPFTFNAVRFLLAGVMMALPVFLTFKHKKINFKRSTLFSGMLLGVFLFIGYGFQTIGLVYTTSSKAAFITGLSVILVPITGFVLFKHKPRFIIWISSVLSVFGLYMITMTGGGSFNLGDFFVLICAVGFAFHILTTGKFSATHDALHLTIVQIMTVGVLSALSALILEDWVRTLNPAYIFQFDVILALLVTAIFATAIAFFIQTKVQKYTSAARVAIIFAFEPVFAALTAFLFAGEQLTVAAGVGFFFIFAAMILAELPSKKETLASGSTELYPAKTKDRIS